MPRFSLSLKTDILFLAWMMILLFIPLLSANGRFLQSWVVTVLGYPLAAVIISTALAVTVAGLLWLLHKQGLGLPVKHLLWMLPLFLCAPLLLHRVEERLHFLVFGIFGALSMLVYRPRRAFAFCLAVAFGDELLQYFLPDRVGDWRDVTVNSVASLAAAFFVWTSFVRPSKLGMDKSCFPE
ncbi:MAG: VanZ family protein [Desulfuromonadales bacterium]|jgi:VanZ family protein|nr:VanZ family protein [Desulfuromonadales bacterium]